MMDDVVIHNDCEPCIACSSTSQLIDADQVDSLQGAGNHTGKGIVTNFHLESQTLILAGVVVSFIISCYGLSNKTVIEYFLKHIKSYKFVYHMYILVPMF